MDYRVGSTGLKPGVNESGLNRTIAIHLDTSCEIAIILQLKKLNVTTLSDAARVSFN